MRLFIIIFFAIAIIQSGCFPTIDTMTVSPELCGRVLDEDSGLGLSGAKIIYIVKDLNSSRSYCALGCTDELGYFQVGPLRHWFYLVYMGSPGYYPALPAIWGVTSSLTVTKEGYCMKKIELMFPYYDPDYFYFNNEKYKIDECIYLWLERED